MKDKVKRTNWKQYKNTFKRDGKKYLCINCNAEAPSQRKYCNVCVNKENPKRSIAHLKTLEENSSSSSSPQNKYGKIRMQARAIASEYYVKECYNCGYDKHVECCHIKGIGTFSKETLIGEINNIKNLVFLCPNCHWEFDKGLLVITS